MACRGVSHLPFPWMTLSLRQLWQGTQENDPQLPQRSSMLMKVQGNSAGICPAVSPDKCGFIYSSCEFAWMSSPLAVCDLTFRVPSPGSGRQPPCTNSGCKKYLRQDSHHDPTVSPQAPAEL